MRPNRYPIFNYITKLINIWYLCVYDWLTWKKMWGNQPWQLVQCLRGGLQMYMVSLQPQRKYISTEFHPLIVNPQLIKYMILFPSKWGMGGCTVVIYFFIDYRVFLSFRLWLDLIRPSYGSWSVIRGY